jgi:hypothetical protein
MPYRPAAVSSQKPAQRGRQDTTSESSSGDDDDDDDVEEQPKKAPQKTAAPQKTTSTALEPSSKTGMKKFEEGFNNFGRCAPGSTRPRLALAPNPAVRARGFAG